MFDQSSRQRFLALRQAAFDPQASLWLICVEERETCHTDPGFRQRLVFNSIPIIIGGRRLK